MPSAFRRAGTGNKVATSSPTSVASSSSSRRSSSVLSSLRGVKPWQGGSYLTSVGLNDLDTILGGGQPLGTAILLEEDRWTRDLAISLVKYWCAEAVSQDHHLVIPLLPQTGGGDSTTETNDDDELTDILGDMSLSDFEMSSKRADLEDILSAIPRNLHWDKQKKYAGKANSNAGGDGTTGSQHRPTDTFDILEEDEEDEETMGSEKNEDEGLEIAWQYKKSVQQERLATPLSQSTTSGTRTDVFCHSYDLSGRMKDQEASLDLSGCIAELPSFSTDQSAKVSSPHSRGMMLFRDLTRLLKVKLEADGGKAVRLLLYHPSLQILGVTLPLLIAYIRKNSLPVVVLMCTTPTADIDSWARLARNSDVVLSTEGFASRKEYPPPPEFRHLQGVLKISKTTRKNTEIVASIYGFKRDRRKLHIQLLHIPPEDYAENGGSVGAGGVRSGAGRPANTNKSEGAKPTRKAGTSAGMGCSSNMSGSLLDF